MCNEREYAVPQYTTVSTDYLDELMAAKMGLDIITKNVIKAEYIKMLCDSMLKAKVKHPQFADQVSECSLKEVRKHLDDVRSKNDIQENCGCSVADEILCEEYLEAMEQYRLGNKAECLKELADTIVVLFRMMEMIDKEIK